MSASNLHHSCASQGVMARMGGVFTPWSQHSWGRRLLLGDSCIQHWLRLGCAVAASKNRGSSGSPSNRCGAGQGQQGLGLEWVCSRNSLPIVMP